MKAALKYFWQLPQHILALILIFLYRDQTREKYYEEGNWVYRISNIRFGGVSLGTYIILDTRYPKDPTVKHERGHSKQSLIFGWLYLIIIGIPSATMNLLTRIKILKSENYYKRWPENWADKLGGVTRQ